MSSLSQDPKPGLLYTDTCARGVRAVQVFRGIDGRLYTLIYFSKRYPLGKEDLVRLAESMTLEPVTK